MRILRKTLVKNPRKSYYDCVICGHFIYGEHYNVALLGYDDEFLHGRAHLDCISGEEEVERKKMVRMGIATSKADAFNNQYPVGTLVTLKDDSGKFVETETRTPAWVLGSGVAVVSVVGIAGGYLLDRINPISQGLTLTPHNIVYATLTAGSVCGMRYCIVCGCKIAEGKILCSDHKDVKKHINSGTYQCSNCFKYIRNITEAKYCYYCGA